MMEEKPADIAHHPAAEPGANIGEASTDSQTRVSSSTVDGNGTTGETVVTQSAPRPDASPTAEQDNHAIIAEAVAQALKEEKPPTDMAEIKELLRQVVENTQTPAAASSPPTTVTSAEKALEMKESFRQAALDAYREEYKELTEVWKVLETKAQGTVTIAGIFIAAAFTFAKDLAATRLDFYGNLLLGAAIVCLIFSIVFSVLALRTREVNLPPAGARVRTMADHYKDAMDADLPDRKRRFINQQANEWQIVVDDARDDIEDKERWLRTAQGFLVIAIITAAAITLSLLKI